MINQEIKSVQAENQSLRKQNAQLPHYKNENENLKVFLIVLSVQ